MVGEPPEAAARARHRRFVLVGDVPRLAAEPPAGVRARLTLYVLPSPIYIGAVKEIADAKLSTRQ